MISKLVPHFILALLLPASSAFGQAPANDNRASAITLDIDETIQGTLLDATVEENEPLDGPRTRTVWYRWEATPGSWEARLTSRENRVIALAYLEDDNGNLLEISRTAFPRQEDSTPEKPYLSSQGLRLNLATNSTLWIQIYNISATTGDFSLKLSSLEGSSAGDAFANATTLPATVNNLQLDLGFATRELNEPPTAFQGTVWRRWTLPADGPWLVTSRGFSGSASVDVWEGESPDQLIPREIASGNLRPDQVGSSSSTLIFDGRAGDAIFIRLASDQISVVSLSIARPTPGDLLSQPTDLGEVEQASMTFSRDQPLTVEPNEPYPPGLSRWLAWTAPSSGVYEITASAPSSPPGSFSIRGLSPFVALFSVDPQGTLNRTPTVPFNFNNPFTSSERFRRFRATAGMNYLIQAGTTPFDGFISFDSGIGQAFGLPTQLTLTLNKVLTTLPNDHFADARDWGATNAATDTGSNVGATNEEGEIIEQFGEGNSVWHRWTPAETGRFEMRFTSEQGLQFALYQGSSLSDLTLITAARLTFNSGPKSAVVRFEGVANEEHYLRVTSQANAEGSYQVALLPAAPPANDHYSDAPELSGDLPITASGSTRFATMEYPYDGSQASVNRQQESTIWWKWTATETGFYELQSNATLGLLEDGNKVGHDLTAANDRLRFIAEVGREYHFRVAHRRENEAPVSLSLQPITGFENATLATALELDTSLPLTTPAIEVLGGTVLIDDQKTVGRAVFRWTPPSSGWVKIHSPPGSTFRLTAVLENLNENSLLSLPPQITNSLDFTLWSNNNYTPPQRTISAPLRSTTKLRPGTVPLGALGHMQVQAGTTYHLIATPETRFETSAEETTTVQLKIDRIAPPPALLSAQWKRLPDRNMLEATFSIDSPNGFSNGTVNLSSRQRWFDASHRISGDLFRGDYRIIVPISFGSGELTLPSTITLRDQAGASSALPAGEIPIAADQPSSDRQGPYLHGVTRIPPEILLSGSETTIILELAITDDEGSGFANGEILLPGAFIRTPLGQVSPRDDRIIPFDAIHRIAGDSQAGLYQVEVTIAATSIPGDLTCRLRDHAGNLSGTWEGRSGGDIIQYNFQNGHRLPVRLVRENSTSPLSPVIEITNVHVSDTPLTEIQTSAHLTHPLGISRGRLVLQDEFGTIITSQQFDGESLVAGTLQDGQFEVSLPLPFQRAGGDYWLSWEVIAQDGAVSTTSSPNPLSLNRQRFGDQRNPLLTRFEIAPKLIELNDQEETVTIELAAHDDQPGLKALVFIFDHEGHEISQILIDCLEDHLDCQTTLTLPQTDLTSPSRFARIEVILLDASGRTTIYGRTDSPSWPAQFSPQLALTAKQPDHLTQWYRQWTDLREIPDSPDHDLDRDGWTDLIEFAIATDPSTPASRDPLASLLPSLNFWGSFYSGTRKFRSHTFTTQIAPWFLTDPQNRTTSTRFELIMEGSNDLKTWDPLPSGGPTFPSLPSSPRSLSISDSTPSTQRIRAYRLRVN